MTHVTFEFYSNPNLSVDPARVNRVLLCPSDIILFLTS